MVVVVDVVVVLVTVVVVVSEAFTNFSLFTSSNTIKRFSMILQAAIM